MKEDLKLVLGNTSDIKIILEIMKKDFPFEELKPDQHMFYLINNFPYRLYLLKEHNSLEYLAYAFILEMEEPKSLYIDYLAVNQLFQGQGYGTIMMNKLIEKSINDHNIGIVLETEPADECPNSVYCRRERFYKRLGFIKLDVNYLMPTPNESKGIPFSLWMLPHQEEVSKLTMQQIVCQFNLVIYSHFNYTQDIINSYIGNLTDLKISELRKNN